MHGYRESFRYLLYLTFSVKRISSPCSPEPKPSSDLERTRGSAGHHRGHGTISSWDNSQGLSSAMVIDLLVVRDPKWLNVFARLSSRRGEDLASKLSLSAAEASKEYLGRKPLTRQLKLYFFCDDAVLGLAIYW